MKRTVFAASRRHFVRHPGQLVLGLVGLALGVAVIVSIHMTRESARAAFDLTAEILKGRATHRVVGGPSGVDEGLYAALRTELGVHRSAPVIDVRVTAPEHDVAALRLLGVDPIAEGVLRPGFGSAPGRSTGLDITALMSEPGTGVVNAATAARLGLAGGDTLMLRQGGRDFVLELFEPVVSAEDDFPWLADNVVLVDIATAQERLASAGRLSRIDLDLAATGGVTAAGVAAWLPAGYRLVPADQQGADLDELTGAFYLNLTALGLLALLVGMFLTYSTQSFLVTQRRELFGQLRAVGVTRRELALVVLLESLLVGAAGALLGILLGYLLSHLLLKSVALTLNDLYLTVAVDELKLSAGLALAGFALGVAAAVVASLSAVMVAGATPVLNMARIEIEKSAGRRMRWAVAAGVALVAAAVAVAVVSERSLMLGFFSLFCFAFGAALLTPALMQRGLALIRAVLVRPAGRGPFAFRQALNLARNAVSRTGVASAALMMAAATGIGVTTMVASFRGSVDDWLTQLLRADVYLAGAGPDAAFGRPAFDRLLLDRLERDPAIETVSSVRRVEVPMPAAGDARAGPGGPVPEVRLVAYDVHREAFSGFDFLAGDADDVWSRWEAPDTVIVTEPFAWRHQLEVGSSLRLLTPDGPRPFRVRGIYRDYGSERGTIAISARQYARWWGDDTVDGIGVYGAPERPLTEIKAAVTRIVPADINFEMTDTAAVRALSLEVFDRTFVVTGVLRNLALVIACCGMFSSLLALGIERARLLAVYRALGTSARELFLMTLTESGLVGLAAALIAVPTGIVMALGLIEIINVRSFGWSMALAVPPGAVASVVVIAVAAALAAGVYPAWRAARLPIAAALHGE